MYHIAFASLTYMLQQFFLAPISLLQPFRTYTSSAITGKGLFDSILLKSIPLIPLLLLILFK